MKNPFLFLLTLGLIGAVFYFWKRRTAAVMPDSTFFGEPMKQANADSTTLAATLAVMPPNATLAWIAGETMSLAGSLSSGDFGIANKMLGTATPVFIQASTINPSPV